MTTTAVVIQPAVQNLDEPKYRCCCQKLHVTTGVKVIGILEALSLVCGVIGSIEKYANFGSAYASTFWPYLLSSLVWGAVIFCLFWALRTERAIFILPHLCVQGVTLVALAIVVIFVIVGLAVGGGILLSLAPGHVTTQETSVINTISQNRVKRQGDDDIFGNQQFPTDEEFDKQVADSKAKQEERTKAWNKETEQMRKQNEKEAMEVGGAFLVVVGVVFLFMFAIVFGLELWFFLVVLRCYQFLKETENRKKSMGLHPLAESEVLEHEK